MSLIFGALLGFAAIFFKVTEDPIIDQVENLMPQTQCGQCGYPGCRPYAKAVIEGDAINKCTPGGATTIKALAEILGRDLPDFNDDEDHNTIKQHAFIDEDACIGCTKCIQVCPVDAILGAVKLMHTVIQNECTGCEICIDSCPKDCIEMKPIQLKPATWCWPTPKKQQIGSIIISDRMNENQTV